MEEKEKLNEENEDEENEEDEDAVAIIGISGRFPEGFMDEIRCDESSYLIWKWHPDQFNEGQLKRETAIRTNSVLRVKSGEVAVFVYKQKEF